MTMSDGINDPDQVLDQYDTPTERATINQVSVDKLDEWLSAIRERRLKTVKKLEQAAKVRADDVRLKSFLLFHNAYERARKALTKLEEQDAKVEAMVHKVRVLALTAQLEVGVIPDGDADDEDGTSEST